MCPAKTQISLGIRPVWSESSLSAWRKLVSLPIERTAKTLIRLGGCTGWPESSLGALAILLVLSCVGSFKNTRKRVITGFPCGRGLKNKTILRPVFAFFSPKCSLLLKDIFISMAFSQEKCKSEWFRQNKFVSFAHIDVQTVTSFI